MAAILAMQGTSNSPTNAGGAGGLYNSIQRHLYPSPNAPVLPTTNTQNNPLVANTITSPSQLMSTVQIAALAAQGNVQPGKAKKRPEPLFGPDVGGEGEDEKGWTTGQTNTGQIGEEKVNSNGGALGEDATGLGIGNKVGLDIVKGWVEKAKSEGEGVHPTTTLQALVNLKRPTLGLVPISSASSTGGLGSDLTPAGTGFGNKHSLRFVYDSSTPTLTISVLIYPTPVPNSNSDSHSGLANTNAYASPQLVYSGTHQGGFGKVFELPSDSAMDLDSEMDKILAAAAEAARKSVDGDGSTLDGKEGKEEGQHGTSAGGGGGNNTNNGGHNNGINGNGVNGGNQAANTAAAQATNTSRLSGLSSFLPGRARRQREQDIEAQMLAGMTGNTVAEAMEMQPTGANAVNNNNNLNGGAANGVVGVDGEKKEVEQGIRVLIKLEGLGVDGQPLTSRNAQLTHVLVTSSMTPAVAAVEGAEGEVAVEGAEAAAATSGEEGVAAVEAQKKRVWMIKVARREAVIGSHTFLLKEIYGLASSTQTDSSTNAATPAISTSYPPTPGINAVEDPYASTPNECIVCLTSPRDVVLLPCRHLVVCRECAVGMVEFGAGGKVARREEVATDTVPTVPAETTVTVTNEDGTTTTTPAPAAPAAPAPTTGRRKKKAKGWFCPVCRQPYTSLLRLALPHAKAPTTMASRAASRAVSRAPSRAASIHHSIHGGGGGASLHRVSSRATLPERGERMLEAITPQVAADDEADQAERDREEAVDPTETESERREREQQEEMDREEIERSKPQFVLGEEIGHGHEHDGVAEGSAGVTKDAGDVEKGPEPVVGK